MISEPGFVQCVEQVRAFVIIEISEIEHRFAKVVGDAVVLKIQIFDWINFRHAGYQNTAAVHAQVGISTTQYYRLKRRYLAEGLAQALEERPRSGQPPKVTPALEARITSLACSDLPAGAARWTLSLLNENLVTLDYGPAVSRETIRQVLKKANSNPG